MLENIGEFVEDANDKEILVIVIIVNRLEELAKENKTVSFAKLCKDIDLECHKVFGRIATKKRGEMILNASMEIINNILNWDKIVINFQKIRKRIMLKKNIKNKYYPDYVLPPGATLMDVLTEKQISKFDLEKLLKMSKQEFSIFIKGKSILSREIAVILEEFLGIPSEFWLNLEKFYREKNPLEEF